MIWCVGESLYDVVFKDAQPQWAVPGGSMLNAAVSASRSGEEVSLISELGDDAVGEMILNFLEDNKVGTGMISRYKGNTTLALAFLNASGDARYQFYQSAPQKAPDFKIPPFSVGDVLMFGSFYSISLRNRANIKALANAARKAGAAIYYDPNFRKPHLGQLEETLPYIRENIGMADIVRGSDEDFSLIADAGSNEAAMDFIQSCGGKTLIYTRNIHGIHLFTPDLKKHYKATETEVVSTIGAGDSFNAGMVVSIHRKGNFKFTDTEWDEAIARAVIFATEVCRSRDNFIGKPATSP